MASIKFQEAEILTQKASPILRIIALPKVLTLGLGLSLLIALPFCQSSACLLPSLSASLPAPFCWLPPYWCAQQLASMPPRTSFSSHHASSSCLYDHKRDYWRLNQSISPSTLPFFMSPNLHSSLHFSASMPPPCLTTFSLPCHFSLHCYLVTFSFRKARGLVQKPEVKDGASLGAGREAQRPRLGLAQCYCSLDSAQVDPPDKQTS